MVGLLLLGLSTVHGLTWLEVKEGENVTLQWDSSTMTDLSSFDIVCLFGPVESVRRVFDMAQGVENIKLQDSQFSGRVHCDREGLTRGQVRILLTGLRSQDSGHYLCEMADTTDPNKEVSTEDFVINLITPAVSTFGIPDAEQRNEDTDNQRNKPLHSFYNQNSLKIAPIIIVIGLMAVVIWKCIIPRCDCKQRRSTSVPCKRPACPSMGVDPSFHLVLPEVSPFPTGFLEFFLAGKKGPRTEDIELGTNA